MVLRALPSENPLTWTKLGRLTREVRFPALPRPPAGRWSANGLRALDDARTCCTLGDDYGQSSSPMRPLRKLLPGDISTFSGEVVETDHVEEVSGQMMNGSGSTWTDVHRELWVLPSHGPERRFTFTNVAIPARKGHRVTVLIGAGRPLAIVNFSTEQYVNLVTPRDFELFNVADAFAFAVLLVGAGLTGPTALLALTSVTGGYALMKWLLRQQRYRKTRRLVETEIQQTVTAQSIH